MRRMDRELRTVAEGVRDEEEKAMARVAAFRSHDRQVRGDSFGATAPPPIHVISHLVVQDTTTSVEGDYTTTRHKASYRKKNATPLPSSQSFPEAARQLDLFKQIPLRCEQLLPAAPATIQPDTSLELHQSDRYAFRLTCTGQPRKN